MNYPAIIIEVLSWASILVGAGALIVGSIGTLRFPDFWARLHAASVTDSAGIIFLTLGMCLQAGLSLVTVKLIIIGVFLFITGPTATHAVANAAYVSGSRPGDGKIAGESEPEEETKAAPRRTAAKRSSTKTAAKRGSGKGKAKPAKTRKKGG